MEPLKKGQVECIIEWIDEYNELYKMLTENKWI